MKLFFENILSFGGSITNCVDFDGGTVQQIYGENGLGKSNISKILKMAMYFDYPSIQTDIVNDQSESGFIELHYFGYVVRQDYTKKHGLKSITVTENGIKKDTGGVSATKIWLSTHLFVVPKDVFYNVYIPNIDQFKSFIGMTPSDSRKIRDELFSLSPINKKLEETKKAISALAKEISDKELVLETKKTSVEIQKANIRETEETIKETSKNEEAKLTNKLVEVADKLGAVGKEITDQTIRQTRMDGKRLSLAAHKEQQLKKEVLSQIDVKEKEAETISIKISNNKAIVDAWLLNEKKIEKRDAQNELAEANCELTKQNWKLVDAKNLKKTAETIKKQNEYLEAKTNIVTVNESLSILDKKLEDLKNSKTEISETYAKVMAERGMAKNMLDVIALGECCPTCNQAIPKDIVAMKQQYTDTFDKKTAEAKELVKNSKTAADNIAKLEAEIKSGEKEKDTLDSFISSVDEEVINFNYDESTIIDEEKVDEEVKTLEAEVKTLSNKILLLENKVSNMADIGEGINEALNLEEYNEAEKNVTILEEEMVAIVAETNKLKGTIQHITDLTEDQQKTIDEDLKEYPTIDVILAEEQKITQDRNTSLDSEKKLIAEKATLEENLKTVKKAVEDDKSLASMKVLLKNEQIEIDEIEKEIQPKSQKLRDLQILEFVFSDSGMKKWILNKLKMRFTKNVNEGLNQFKLAVRFDENFSISVFKKGKETSTSLISTGQKKIIDTTICMCLLDMYEQKMKSGYPIILDECLSSLSSKNTNLLLKNVKEKVASIGLGMKFVNHAKVNANMYDGTIELRENNNYTTMYVE